MMQSNLKEEGSDVDYGEPDSRSNHEHDSGRMTIKQKKGNTDAQMAVFSFCSFCTGLDASP